MTEINNKDFNMFMFGNSGFANSDAINDMNNYEKYRNGVLVSDYNTLINMKILYVLDNLGYPMDKIGTYLYKDIIFKLYQLVLEVDETYNMDKYNEMVINIKNPFGCLYHGIAREDKDMGVKSFHAYIEEAIGNIDENKINKELSMRIFGKKQVEIDYGEQALLLARFIAGQYEYINIDKYSKPLVRGLKFDNKG